MSLALAIGLKGNCYDQEKVDEAIRKKAYV